MRITEIMIEGFGVFHHVAVRNLSPGLTVFEGHNEAGKTTMMSFIRAMLFGFESRRSGANRYEPLQGGRYGGAVHVMTEEQREYRIERVEAGGRNRVKVVPLAGSSQEAPEGESSHREEELLQRLLYGTSKYLYQNVFAFGIGELERLDTLQADEVSAHIYTVGMGTGLTPLTTVFSGLDAEQAQLFKPGGKKPIINQLLQRLDETQTAIRDLQTLPDEFFTLRDRLAVLDREIHQYQIQLEEAKQHANWLECLVKARPDWEKLQVVRKELSDSPHIDSFPAGGVERLEQLLRSLSSLETRLDDTQRAIARAESRREELKPDRLLLAHQADIEALEDLRGQAKGQADSLLDYRSRLAFRRKVLDEIFSRLGSGWTDERLDHFQASIPLREQIRGLRDRLDDARHKMAEAARRQDEIEKTRRDKENELERLQQKVDQLGAPESSGRPSLQEREQALRQWVDWQHQVELTRQHRADIQTQASTLDHQIQAQIAEITLTESQQGFPVWVLAVVGLVFAAPVGFFLWEQEWMFAGILGGAGLVILALLGWWRSRFLNQRMVRLDLLRSQIHALEEEAEHLRQESRRTQQEEAHRLALMSSLSQQVSEIEHFTPDDADNALRALKAERRLVERREDLTMTMQDAEEALVEILEEREMAGKALQASERAMEEAQESWTAFLSTLGLPDDLTPDGALEVLSGIERAQVQLEEWRDVKRELHRLETQIAENSERLNAVLAMCQWDPVSPSEYSSTLGTLRKSLDQSIRVNLELEQLNQWIREKYTEYEGGEAEKSRHLEQLMGLLQAGGATDAESFRNRAGLYARQVELERQQRQLEVAFQVHAGSEERARRMEEVLSVKSRADLEREFHEISQDGQQRLQDILTKQIQEKGRVEQQLQDLEQNERLSESMLEYQSLLAQLEHQAERWSIRAISRHVLEKARQIYERERQPAVLREASKFFQVMTGGRYIRIMVPLGEMRLEIESADGHVRGTEALSRGTAEQLYLAMRLAFIREYAKHAGPLPLVIDDILVNFDPVRAKATIQVLQDIATSHQVLVFTCHPNICQWFQETVSDVAIRMIPQSTAS